MNSLVTPKMRIVFLGPPGAGKGTQSKRILKEYGIPATSTGDIFRAAIDEGSELGLLAKKYVDAGQLVPDEVTIKIVEGLGFIENSFLLDGFPRTVPQAKAFDELLESHNAPLTHILNLVVSDPEILIKRILNRGEGRTDDTEETLRTRFKEYETKTAPLVSYYSSRVTEIDGIGTQDEVASRIVRALTP